MPVEINSTAGSPFTVLTAAERQKWSRTSVAEMQIQFRILDSTACA